jgi:RNA polymerase sigma-70 factor, ECF subfamily
MDILHIVMVSGDLPDQDPDASEDSFGQLVNNYQEKVINTCYGFVHNLQDAEDVAQEVFIEVYRALDSFKGQSALYTWVYRIAVNKSLDFVRKRGRKKRFGHLKRFLGFEDEHDDRPFDQADTATPLDTLQQQERAAILHQAIAALPEKQQVALTLHKFEGLAHTEVARIMETTVSSVESLLHRAKKNLHKRLSNYYDEKIPNGPQG